MAKGKKAAAAARRRLTEAEDRVSQLEGQLQQERQEAHAREEELKREARELRSRISNDLEAEVQSAVSEAKASLERERQDLRRELRHRSIGTVEIISQGIKDEAGFSLSLPLWKSLCDVTGLPRHFLLEKFGTQTVARADRRARASQLSKDSLLTSVRTRPGLEDFGKGLS